MVGNARAASQQGVEMRELGFGGLLEVRLVRFRVGEVFSAVVAAWSDR